MVAMILTLQEYYGGRSTYDDVIRPWLSVSKLVKGHTRINLARTTSSTVRVVVVHRFRRVRDPPVSRLQIHLSEGQPARHGLRVRGLFEHTWI